MKHSKYCTFFLRTWCITHQDINRALWFTKTQSYNIKEFKFCRCSCQCKIIILNNKQFRIEFPVIYFKRVIWFCLFTLLMINRWKILNTHLNTWWLFSSSFHWFPWWLFSSSSFHWFPWRLFSSLHWSPWWLLSYWFLWFLMTSFCSTCVWFSVYKRRKIEMSDILLYCDDFLAFR